MIRFREYLNEDTYLDSIKPNGWKKGDPLIDIYKNPSKTDIAKMKKVRFILDAQTKTCYMWDASVMHWDATQVINKHADIPEDMMASSLYGLLDKGWLRYFLGSRSGDKVESDILDSFSFDDWAWNRGEKGEVEKAKKQVQKIAAMDWSWASRYGIDPGKIKKILDDLKHETEKR